jgi:hypothetical protein
MVLTSRLRIPSLIEAKLSQTPPFLKPDAPAGRFFGANRADI